MWRRGIFLGNKNYLFGMKCAEMSFNERMVIFNKISSINLIFNQLLKWKVLDIKPTGVNIYLLQIIRDNLNFSCYGFSINLRFWNCISKIRFFCTTPWKPKIGFWLFSKGSNLFTLKHIWCTDVHVIIDSEPMLNQWNIFTR